MWTFSWVLIPIAAILAGMWSEWLKFKKEQAKLGSAAYNLEASLDEVTKRLEAQNQALVERIQNLEAIVTSAEWDRMAPMESAAEPEPRIVIPDPQEENREEAARLAQRLRS